MVPQRAVSMLALPLGDYILVTLLSEVSVSSSTNEPSRQDTLQGPPQLQQSMQLKLEQGRVH